MVEDAQIKTASGRIDGLDDAQQRTAELAPSAATTSGARS
ncbi:hypothetical protein Z046_02635 [Pseudomonas aeruginosa VRFPA09]|nr:hypothetical protein Z046_02635 [Pseudomonas aeruginosa VRFPA09]